MRPDPVRRGQAVRDWVVRLQSRPTTNCAATLTIVDRDQVVGTVRIVSIRPGDNEIAVQARSGYQFQPRDHCYIVQADIAGNRVAIDTQRQFCARYRSGQGLWTMNP